VIVAQRKVRFGQVPILTKQASTVTRAAKAGACVEAADRLTMQADNLSTSMAGKRVLGRTQQVVDKLCGRGFVTALARNTRIRSIARAVEKPSPRTCIRAAFEVGSVLALAPDKSSRADAEAIAEFVERQCGPKVWPAAERIQRRKTVIGLRVGGARRVTEFMPGMRRRTAPDLIFTEEGELEPTEQVIGRGKRTAEEKAEQMTDAAARSLIARIQKGEVDLSTVAEPVLQRIAVYAKARAAREGKDVRATAKELVGKPSIRRSFQPIKRR
jgi:hypothetical protein